MKPVARLVNNYCSAGCFHCPYAHPIGVDYPYPFKHIVDEVTILTGGEPLESPQLHDWIKCQIRENIPFRIATGGHIALRGWRAQLWNEPLFLGFNMGTDVLLFGTETQRMVWYENWQLVASDKGTWLTITVGPRCGSTEITEIISNLKPSILMINSVNGYENPAAQVLGQLRTSDQLQVIEGYLG